MKRLCFLKTFPRFMTLFGFVIPAIAFAQNPAVPAPASPHLLLDWSFWAAVVAALALVLSQLPPILTIIRRSKVEMELYSRIHVNHRIGNPILQLHLILRNIGGRSVRISGIKLQIKRDGSEIATLPALNYLPDPNDGKKVVLFTRIQLNSDTEWAYFTTFFNYPSRSDEKAYRAAEAALRQNYMAKQALAGGPNKNVEADPPFVAPFQKLFQQSFIWSPGEYEVRISVEASDGRIVREKNFSFTLFETDSNDLIKVTEDYKIGDGINWDSGKYIGVYVPIRVVTS